MRDLRKVLIALLAALVVVVTLQSAQSVTDDDRALEAHRLTIDGLKKATDANKALVKLTDADPSIATRLKSNTDDRTLTAMVKRLEGEPKVIEALKEVGITARTYSLTMVTAFQASMMAEMHSDVVNLPGVMGDNVVFINDHPVEVAAFFKSTEKLSESK